jgi:hypothetical protein
MKPIFTTLGILFLAASSHAQIARDFMIGGGLDMIKTDNNGLLAKGQFGGEGHYFITRDFTLSGGLEGWTNSGVSLTVGTRWYPTENAFVRVRGIIGENDLSIGGGWSKPLNENFRFEAMGDFYFEGDFAVRAGIMYIIRRK